MAFNVNYSFNNGDETGTATSFNDLRTAITSFTNLTQCTLSGTAEGELHGGDYAGLFDTCEFLTSIDISNLDTSNVTNMLGMFKDCARLTTLDLSHLDTSNAFDLSSMFENCFSLTSLDLSNFDTKNVANMGAMFDNCENLEHIYVGENWSIDAVMSATNMFYGCFKLPNFVYENTDETMAKQTWEGGYLEGIEEPSSSKFINVAKFVSNSNEIAAMYEQEENLL